MNFIKYFFGDPPVTIGDKTDLRKILGDRKTDRLISNIISAGQDGYILTDLHDEIYQTACDISDTGIITVDRNFHIRMSCPVFIEDDLAILRNLTSAHAKKLAAEIAVSKSACKKVVAGLDDRFDPEVHLYHLLCGAVFDGYLFDALGDAGVVTISKIQRNGYDYLPVLYEDTKSIGAFSAGLLCSYNRLEGKHGVFSSFGDADGNRHDMFRWYQKRCGGHTGFSDQSDSLYDEYDGECIKDILSEKFVEACSGIRIDEKWIKAFEWAGYMKDKEISVPVYNNEERKNIVRQLSEITSGIIFDDICDALQAISSADTLASVRLGIPPNDIANEVYHLLFGQINEELIKCGFAAEPKYYSGQGRYLKCFETK